MLRETLLEIAQDWRDQTDSFGSEGWTNAHTLWAWGVAVVVILLIWGDGGWPWQRKHP